VGEWIRNQNSSVVCFCENCGQQAIYDEKTYIVSDEDLEQARYAYKTVSQTALDVGSEVHNAIEVYMKREIARKSDGEGHFDLTDPVYATLSEQAMRSFNAFNAWYKEHNLKPIAVEQTVYGDCWAGTLDYIGYFDDKLYVIDWKSSKGFYPEMRYQVAAYRDAVPVLSLPITGTKYKPKWKEIDGCGVLRLDKETGLPDWHDTSKTYESDLKVFNAMHRLYMLRHPRIAKAAGWRG